MSPTTLYRLYSAGGRCLYIGIAGNPGRRFQQHAGDKPWWREVHHIAVEHFDQRTTAEQAEVRAIRTEDPLYNVAHAITHQPTPPAPPAPRPQPLSRQAPLRLATANRLARSRWLRRLVLQLARQTERPVTVARLPFVERKVGNITILTGDRHGEV
jgi:predicted GIY-YIG superfamily endonuclease